MNSTLKHLLVNLLVVLLVLEPFSFAIAGGIVVAPGAPATKQPTVEAAPNGVPVINIVKPSASGVSHNQYDQFNVATKGVIINNSSRPGVSQLGGAISGNTNFSGGPEARLILNEVTGSSRSNIEGYTEIFGYAAQYILANPNGISVNGGGFINTPKATLTTGVPRLDGSGALLGLDVRRGDVLIDGQGINADNIDAFEIVSRTAKINAEIHAKQLNIIAGQGSYNPTTGQATALAPDGSAAPTVVLDSTALGGMYAQRIKFVGTEAGVGVNLHGLTQATENLTLTADGKVEIKGTASSGKDLALGSTSDSVVVSGKVVAAGKAALTAGNAVETTEPVGSDAPVIKAGSVAIDAGSVNNRSMIVADTSFDIATRGSVTNTGTIYSGGTGFFRVGDTLLNTRGKIYSQGDMSFAGYGAGQRMLTLQNDSGSIESLQGGLGIKADSVLNNNLDFKLEEGAIAGTTVAGGWVERTRNSADTLTLLLWATGHAVTCPFKWDAKRIDPWVVSGLGLDATRNIFSLAELTAAVNKVELEQQSTPNASKKSTADWVKANIIAAQVPYSIVVQSGQRGTILAYEAEIVTDRVTGADKGGSIAASTSILVDADKFTNNVSKFSTATGDITINAGTFENVGKEVYQRSTLSWGRGIHNRVHNKGLHSEGTGQEVVLTPVSYAYGTLDGGNKVSINAAHVTNGIVERNGMFQAPDPTTQQQKVQDVGSFIGTLPKSGLFQTNLTPGHHYLVETNPALTSMSTFYGSDYFLSHAGIDLAKANMQLLGDAFYETNLVRDQIFSLTGKRLLSSSATSDAEQMQALMDSALRAKTSLDLTVGVALSASQIANLTEDIVWLEKTVVDGHEVLVPKVYLASKSLQNIAQGGSVIVGKDVAITSTGDTKNGGVLLAENTLTLNAANIFNTSGTMKGQTVALTATDSIANTSGSISGGDVSLSAGRNIMVDTSKVTFASKSTTSEVAGQRGSVAATGALSMTAGENISIIGADVSAGGDAKLTAGKSVAIATQTLTGKTNIASSGYRRSNNIEANEVSTVTAGGALSVSAGEDILVTGSKVRAGGDASLAAGENLSISSATDKQDYSSYSKSKKGGLFGGKSSESHSGSSTTNVASEISAGGKLSAEAGKAGSGDLVVAGSKVSASKDVSLKSEGNIAIVATQMTSSSHSESKSSGAMGLLSSSATKDNNKVTTVRSEVEAGTDITVEAKQDITLTAAKITSGGETKLTADEGHVSILTSKDSEYNRKVSSNVGALTWSSQDKGKSTETIVNSLFQTGKGLTITSKNGVTVEYKQTGNLRQDIQQLSQAQGLEWMGELLKRDDVNWQAVQEKYESWNHKDGGLSPAATIVLAIAASAAVGVWASQYVAASLMGGTLGNGGVLMIAGVQASATQMAIYSSLVAGITATTSNITVAAANAAAGGDFGKSMKSMVSEEGVRSLLASMLLAGEMSKFGSTFDTYPAAGKVLATTTVKTITSNIVGGQELEKAFLTSLGSSFSSYASGKITGADLNKAVGIILQGASGAAGAALAGGDPLEGAMSSMVSEMASWVKATPLTEEQKAQKEKYAAFSDCAYGDTCAHEQGFTKVSAETMATFLTEKGWKEDEVQAVKDLMKQESGLHFDVYSKDSVGTAKGEVVVAVRGSELTDLNDMATNIKQAIGYVGNEYKDAATPKLLQAFTEFAGEKADLNVTGHSLGGGIATALASTGVFNKAIVFNAAAIHENTIAAVNGNVTNASRTINYDSRGDILGLVQDLFISPLTGVRKYGQVITSDGDGLHGISSMYPQPATK